MCKHTLERERRSKEGERWREIHTHTQREMGSLLSCSLLKRVMTWLSVSKSRKNELNQ